MRMTGNLFIVGLFLLAACSERQEEALLDADTILYNGKVVTLDSASTIASTVVIDGERIVAVGGEELLARYKANETADLQGKTLLPGFVDSHTHIGGRPQRFIDLSKTTSIAQLVQQVRDRASELGPDEWITGYGWSEDQMEELRRPLRNDLDAAAPDNPVMLTRAGGHSAVANSVALELASVDRSTPDPDGGVIEKDENGELNGVIRERQEIVGRLIPEPTDEEVRDSLIAKLREQLSLGITSVVQAMDSIEHYAEWERVYDVHRGELPRAAVQVFWEGPDEMSAFGRRTGDGDDHLRVGPIKIFVDGGFTGPAAFTKEPYRGEAEYRGMLDLTVEELRKIIREANAAGWQLGIHAIGDAAIELTIDELAAALDEHPRDDHRHYLNHFTVMPSAESMDRMAEYDIAITQQPNFTYTLEGRYVAYLDGDRLEHNNPLRTPINHGIHVAISADILPTGPLVGIYAAVTRKGMSGEVFGAEEALTMMEALRGYTWAGAYLTFEEDRKGTIEEGKFADLIVLDKDILTIEPSHIMNIKVDQTWLGGKLVYHRSNSD
jgi:predicted amidohydrolase YtcJ